MNDKCTRVPRRKRWKGNLCSAFSNSFKYERAVRLNLRAEQIVAAVADAAERWRDGDFPPRVRTVKAIAERTGYTGPVVDYALDALFGSIERRALSATICGELGALEALDGFVLRPGRAAVTYRPVEPVTIVSSDTTIGVAIPALVFALCAKATVTVKDRDDRLVAAFAETITSERPELRAAMCVETWSGADEAASRAHLSSAATVVAYGGDETLSAMRALLRPQARFIPFGHRTSAGYAAREALTELATARACANGFAADALLYDGEGCLSLHAAFVERGGAVTPAQFAALVARACDEVAVEFPAGYRERDAGVVGYLRAAEFRAAQGSGEVFPGKTAPHVTVLDPPRDEPPPLLRRTLALYAVDEPAEALALLHRHGIALEAIAAHLPARPDVEALVLASGAARLAAPGTLQRPPLGGEHGGVGRILPFVRAIYR